MWYMLIENSWYNNVYETFISIKKNYNIAVIVHPL
jgi:hypothetical protein